MPKHLRPDNPTQPNQILQIGSRPLPSGRIETMVIIRLFDVSYQLSKEMSLNEYLVTLEGLELCAKQAVHQSHQQEILRAAAEEANSSPRSEYAPTAAPAPSSGSSTGGTRGHGAPE